MPIDPISQRVSDGGYSIPMDNPAVAAAIQKGSVEDVRKALEQLQIPAAALDEFLQNQYYRLIDLYKPEPAYAMGETVPAPSPQSFMEHNLGNALTDSDRGALASLLGKGQTSSKVKGKSGSADVNVGDSYDDVIAQAVQMSVNATNKIMSQNSEATGDEDENDVKAGTINTGKAMTSGKASSAKSVSGKSSGDANLDAAQDHLDEWTNFWDTVYEPAIFEAQLQQELSTKNAELERSFNELLAKARAGGVTDVELILALAKINVEKNGLIFTQLGKRVWNYNKQSVKVTDWLKENTSSADLMAGQQQLKTINQSTTFLMNDMNAVSQNISSVITFLKSSLDAINTQKMEFARKTGLGS